MDDVSSRRPKRQSSSKLKARELLAKVRSSVKDGKKLKYEVGELDNVYDEVDEKEYSRKVLQRQEDDWIVDDDGCDGYVEDGREIFDDDLDEVSMEKSKKDSLGKKRSRSAIEPSTEGKKGNIRNMLVSMPTKKKKNDTAVKLDEDNLLGDIISELDGIKSTPKSSQKSSFGTSSVEKEMSSRDYMQSLKFKRTKPVEKKVLNDQFCSMTRNSDKYSEVMKFSVTPIKSEPLTNSPNGNHVDNSPTLPIKNEVVSNTYDYQTCKEIEVKDEIMDMNSVSLFEGIDTDNLGDLIDHVSRENTPGKEVLENKIKASEPVKKPASAKTLHFLNGSSPKPKIKDCISEDWDESMVNEPPPVNIDIDNSTLPLTKNKNGDDVFRFYYWDANEEIFSKPGTVYLFGKTYVESAKTYASCCVTVNNIERRIFLHPREYRLNLQTSVESSEILSMKDVYDEFNDTISEKFKIKSFKSRKITKKYAFNKQDVLKETEYLEVRYSANFPALPNDLVGETFSCVFGTKTSFLELLILDRGLKGPGWIDIMNAEANPVAISWCKIEVSCSSRSDVVRLSLDEKSDIPPVVMLTMVPYSLYNTKDCCSEVVAVACLVNSTYPVDKPPPHKLFNQHFCVMSHPSDIPWPFDLKEAMHKFTKTHVEKMESERALLSYLLTKIYKIDPDIIVGHDLVGFGIDIIVDQLKTHKVPNWSRLGRLKRTQIPLKAKERIALTGRLLCDVKLSAKEFIRSRSYDLDTLCQNVLHFPESKRPEMNDDIFRCAFNSGESLLNALWTLMLDASYILRIFAELNVLPLCLQISNIAGNVMSRTLLGGRAERNEYLLLHAFHTKGYMVPDKEYKKVTNKKENGAGTEDAEFKTGTRKKPAYAGGLVLDPKVGLYDDLILLMDFNSLYPSIIQEYNVCFTTIHIGSIDMEDDDCLANLDSLLPDDSTPPGILPTEIRKLVESRREVKNMLKKNSNLSEELRMQYDIRQMALKLTANSMYGCLGFSHSRFYAKPLAAIVTEKGREILMNTKRLVESYGHEVIYGDTDSLMINTRTKEFEKVFQIGKKIKLDVNKNYKQVELDIDGVFKNMLLLKKKKYAAITVSKLPNGTLIEKKEMKGLDMVRRDWSQLSSEIGKSILDEILKDQSPDDRIEAIHSYLETVKEELVNGKVPLTLLAVTKQLSKAPEKYSDSKTLPHVQVALRLNQASARRFKQGDTVSYVVCDDGTTNPAMQRAYHIEELKNPEKSLKVDTNYYISQQIYPVIARLCDPIEGTDGASIARSLGLDPSAYRQKSRMCDDENENPDLLIGKKESERYKNCERFSFICHNESCRTENVVEGPTRKLENGMYIVSLEKCVNPSCNAVPTSRASDLQNSVEEKLKKHIDQFDEGWVRCDDSICGFRRQGYDGMKFEDSPFPVCPVCNNGHLRKEITSMQLYNQLSYYSHIFDLSKVAASKRSRIDEETHEVYNQLLFCVNKVFQNNPYYKVKLDLVFSLFSACTLKTQVL